MTNGTDTTNDHQCHVQLRRKSKLKHHHTHTHPFNGPLSGTTQVSRYQKGKNNLDFIEAIDSEWQWHQLGHMQVCTSLQTDNHANTSPLMFFTGRMPFLPPNQQRQSTEGTKTSPHHPPLFTARLHCCNYPHYLKQPILTLKQTNCNTLSLVCLHVIALATQIAPYRSRVYPYLLNYRE